MADVVTWLLQPIASLPKWNRLMFTFRPAVLTMPLHRRRSASLPLLLLVVGLSWIWSSPPLLLVSAGLRGWTDTMGEAVLLRQSQHSDEDDPLAYMEVDDAHPLFASVRDTKMNNSTMAEKVIQRTLATLLEYWKTHEDDPDKEDRTKWAISARWKIYWKMKAHCCNLPKKAWYFLVLERACECPQTTAKDILDLMDHFPIDVSSRK